MFEQYTLIKLTDEYLNLLKKSFANSDHPLLTQPFFVYLGEIPNMPGHCVVAQHGGDGKIVSGFHTENFEILEDY